MIVCPNCKHDNPEGATNCEACYTALPATKACPTCGAAVQLEATFCGQCGHNLQPVNLNAPILLPPPATASESGTVANIGLPATVLTSPDGELAAISINPVVAPSAPEIPIPIASPDLVPPPLTAEAASSPLASLPVVEMATAPTVETTAIPTPQLQTSARQLLHLQTNTVLEIPLYLEVIHVGKPNDRITPDIDVSGFPSAEVVSRIHANIRIEGESYYIEDLGSANGTYINHNVLAKGNRHLLRAGDRIGLGKGDLVTLIFQSAV